MAVGARLFGQVAASGAGLVACDSETCRWQIDARHRRQPSIRSSCCTGPTGSAVGRGRGLVVGIVIVSHSAELAEGVVALAREMGGADVRIEAAGGLDGARAIGTDAERVLEAIERAMCADGVLVLMDLGSALMSAEMAVELLDGDASAC